MTMVMTGNTPVQMKNEPSHRRSVTAVGDIAIGEGFSVVDVRGRDAYFDPDRMMVEQPYRYVLAGIEYIAMLRRDGRVDIFELPSR